LLRRQRARSAAEHIQHVADALKYLARLVHVGKEDTSRVARVLHDASHHMLRCINYEIQSLRLQLRLGRRLAKGVALAGTEHQLTIIHVFSWRCHRLCHLGSVELQE